MYILSCNVYDVNVNVYKRYTCTLLHITVISYTSYYCHIVTYHSAQKVQNSAKFWKWPSGYLL